MSAEIKILSEQVLFKAENVLKMKPHSIVKSTRFTSNTVHDKEQKPQELANLEKGKDGDYNGYMSPATRRQVKGIAENVLVAIKLHGQLEFPKVFPSPNVYPAFVTLTLPAKQMHCDKLIRRECLTPFLQWLTGNKEQGYSGWGVKAYLWVAETQKNGNMHIHLLIDRAVPALRLRQKWNQCLQRLNIIDMYRDFQEMIYEDGFRVRDKMLQLQVEQRITIARKLKIKLTRAKAIVDEKDRQLKAYNEGVASNWSNPNSTDVHSIQNLEKLTAYVTKYMTKEADKQYLKADGTIIKKLAENQRVEKTENGWELITATKMNTDGFNFYVDNREPIKVKFGVRKLRGRIWGCSDSLRQEGVKHFEAILSVFERYERTIEKDITVTRWRRNTSFDLFGNPEYSTEKVLEQQTLRDTFESQRLITSPEVSSYYDHLHATIPKAEIDAATAKTGAHFVAAGGEVIPMLKPLYETLKEDSPSLYHQYFEHYAKVFALLWGEPEHTGVSPPTGVET